MNPRHLTSDCCTPRWRQLSIEAAAIILSILAAFAIDAWWEGRLELREEQELLLGLSAEFEENAALLDTVVARSTRGRLHLQHLVGGSIQELSAIPPNETWASVYEPLIRTWSQSPATGFLDATVNSGKLALIQDLELQAALARFKGLQLDVVEVLEYTNTLNLQAAVILGEFEEVRAQLSRVEAIGAAGQDLPTLSVGTLAAIRSHERLISIAAAKLRYWDGYLGELRLLQENVTTIRSLLVAGQN